MIRRRLVLAVSVTVALAIGLGSWAIVTALENRLISNVDQQFSSGSLSADIRRQLIDRRVAPRQPDVVDAPSDLAIVVYGPGGAIVESLPAGTAADPEPLPDGSQLPADGVVRTLHSVQPGGPRYRAVAVDGATGRARFVVALSLASVDATLAEARRIQLIAGGIAIAVVALVCWLLIRRAFAPIDGMIATAGRIADGDLTERTAVHDDSSEVGRLGGALDVMLDRIEAAVAEKTESEERMRRFVADASHDLRTPLTSVRGYAELYRQDAGNPATVAVSMERIEEEAIRMSRMVDDLMLLARLDQHREPVTRAVDVTEVLGRAVDAIRLTDGERVYDLTSSPDAALRADPDQLRQVFDNLLSNARAHTPPGTTVDVRLDTDPGGVTVVVADDGPGFSDADRAHAFDRFWRATRADQDPGGGSGLGLAIVAAIVEAHRGTITLDTSPAGGARFTIRLPHPVEGYEASAGSTPAP